MAKLSYANFKAMLMNPSIPDQQIAPYLTVNVEESGAFDPRVVPNPDMVEMTEEADFDVENAMRWGNAICRWRRQERFKSEVSNPGHKPVFVPEGDSWFQFPFLIDDVIDHLEKDFLIWSLDAAGDTSDNMVNRMSEYKKGLDEQKVNKVAGFLFSAAGNDVIGEDLFGEPVLGALLMDFDAAKDAAGHINYGQVAQVLARLEADYRKVVATIRLDMDFKRLPIFIHGYDYAIPGGFDGDTRNPIYAKQDQWLGIPMRGKGIVDPILQRDIIKLLIDALYDMLHRISGNSAATQVFVVDVRETLQPNEWNDEIHGTSAGFAKVAAKFKKTILHALDDRYSP